MRSEQASSDSQLRRKRLGLLRTLLNGGRATAAARSVVFGALDWETGGVHTRSLELWKNDVRVFFRRNPRLGEARFDNCTDSEHLGVIARASEKMLNRVLSYVTPADKQAEVLPPISSLPLEEQARLPCCPICQEKFIASRDSQHTSL